MDYIFKQLIPVVFRSNVYIHSHQSHSKATGCGFTFKPSSDPTQFKNHKMDHTTRNRQKQIQKWGCDLDPLQKFDIGNLKVYAIEEVKCKFY